MKHVYMPEFECILLLPFISSYNQLPKVKSEHISLQHPHPYTDSQLSIDSRTRLEN